MADVHSKEVRSYNMSRIRSKNTVPEILLRRFLHAQGFRFRLHNERLPGKPDIVLRKYNIVILVHGCFWHHHKNCKYAKFPKNNSGYWTPKILNNVTRDKENLKALKKAGWKVITIWSCKLKQASINQTFTSLLKKLSQFTFVFYLWIITLFLALTHSVFLCPNFFTWILLDL